MRKTITLVCGNCGKKVAICGKRRASRVVLTRSEAKRKELNAREILRRLRGSG